MKLHFLLCILLICLLFSCKKEVPKGHWHCRALYSNDLRLTIDFENDDEVIFNKYDRHGAIHSKIDGSKSFIPGGGECGVLNLNYELDNDTLYLEQEGLGGKFIGTKCEGNCFDLQKEFFMSDKVDIDLPLIENSMKHVRFKVDDRYVLLLGIPKIMYEEHMSNGHRLCGNGHFMALEDIPFWLEVENNKILKNNRKHARLKIFVDKDLPVNRLGDVLEKLQEDGIQMVYLAFRSSRSIDSELEMDYKEFDMKNINALRKETSYTSFLRAL